MPYWEYCGELQYLGLVAAYFPQYVVELEMQMYNAQEMIVLIQLLLLLLFYLVVF